MTGLDKVTFDRMIDLNPLGEEAASKLTSEAEVLAFVFALIKESSEEEGTDFNKVMKREVLDAVEQCVMEGEEGDGGMGGYAIDLEGEVKSSPLLKKMIRKVSALLSLGNMERVKESFLSLDEDIEVAGREGALISDDISKDAFVEFFLTISDILQFNKIKF